MKRLIAFLVLLVLVGQWHGALAQAVDCFPNCSVDFEAIARERVPVVTTVQAMGTKCDDELTRLLKGYRDEDAREYALLRNQYCSALAGWRQIDECQHGGPPPCCTAPADKMPWRQVGEASAKAVLFTEWHRIQSNRKILAERALNACLRGLKGEGLQDFNASYGRALACLKELQGDVSFNTNQVVDGHIIQSDKGTVDGYVGQLNSLHQRMEALAAAAPDPNNVQNVSNSLALLQTEICGRVTARRLLKNDTKTNKPTKRPGFDSMGRRADVEQPQVETVALTDPKAAAREQHQQQAKSYLDLADKSTGINKTLNLNLSETEATMAGDKALVQRIQQARAQQNAEGLANITESLTNYLASVQKVREEKEQKFNRIVDIRNKDNAVINYYLNRDYQLMIAEQFSDGPTPSTPLVLDKKIPATYFEESSYKFPPHNHVKMIAGWIKNRDFKRATALISDTFTLNYNLANPSQYTRDLVMSGGTQKIFELYDEVFSDVNGLVHCNAKLSSAELKKIDKGTAKDEVYFELGLKAMFGGFRYCQSNTDLNAASKSFTHIADFSTNLFFKKQAYYFLGLIAKSQAYRAHDAKLYEQAITYFEKAWIIEQNSFTPSALEASDRNLLSYYFYHAALANETYFQLLQLSMIQEFAQSNYFLAGLTGNKELYRAGMERYFSYLDDTLGSK